MISIIKTALIKSIKQISHLLSPGFKLYFIDFYRNPKQTYTIQSPHKKLYSIINENRESYSNYLHELKDNLTYYKSIPLKKNHQKSLLPNWNNNYLPGLDILTLYHFIGRFKPETVIEIGSGTSTIVIRNAVSDFNLVTKLISVDPHPRKEIDVLCDEIVRVPLESLTDFEIFKSLEPNDIIFFDGSHRLLTNSDVTHFFLEILPALKKGVLVHFHDIYLPYDYPPFMIEQLYSEQFVLASYLLNNNQRTEIVMPNYFISCDAELSDSINDIWLQLDSTIEKHGGSFWIRI